MWRWKFPESIWNSTFFFIALLYEKKNFWKYSYFQFRIIKQKNIFIAHSILSFFMFETMYRLKFSNLFLNFC